MPTLLDQLAARHHALDPVDVSPFQRKARLLQSLWRQQHRLPPGSQATARGGQRPLGSLLPLPDAQTHLHNFLSDTTKTVVRDEVLDYHMSKGKPYKRPRIFNDLLSTQALSFNLFAELQRDLPLATKLFISLFPTRVQSVTAIHFEHAPTHPSKDAFDLFIEYATPTNGRGFIGLSLKYHENLLGNPAPHRESYDALAARMACFKPDPRLRKSPLQHLWRTHLLVGSTKLAGPYDDALFLLLSPEQNTHVQSAASAYASALTTPDSFSPITLESLTRHLRPHTKSPWLDRFQDRYLNFGKVDAILAKS